MKKLLAALALLCIMTTLVVACGGGSPTGAPPPGGPNGPCPTGRCIVVHLGQTNFDQSSVTLDKGNTLELIDDAAYVHNINYGSWVNGIGQPMQETGAPAVNSLPFTFMSSGQHLTIGPFNTAGTFYLYCRIHTGMNLTITVT